MFQNVEELEATEREENIDSLYKRNVMEAAMQEYVVNRPDEGAMERILDQNVENAAGVILRLAWQAGLLREELQNLSWDQVDLAEGRLLLADRTVPLTEELTAYLETLRQNQTTRSVHVLISDRDQKPLTPQSISRLARRALDAEGQTAVRLIDLRHDFVLRQLERQDWQYVSRVTGIAAATLNLHFAGYLKEKRVSTRIRRNSAPQIDEFSLWKLLQAERATPAGAALWLTWQLGLQLEEIISLAWDQVDLEQGLLHLADRTVPLTGGVLGVLRDLRETDSSASYVVTAPRSGRPYDRTQLSRLVRTALVRGGMDDVTLRDLRMDCAIRTGGENEVVAYLRRNRSITRRETAELLGISSAAAYYRIQQMVARGRLAQIGARYYLRESVVPPEQHEGAILDYLTRDGFAYRQDIARLLKIDPRQCRPILQRMIAAGQITQERQRYTLKKDA